MFVLIVDAVLVCKHELGVIDIKESQSFVTVAGRPVLVDDDPENRSIAGCPNVGVAIKPCQHTLRVKEGYSHWVTIGGKRICLDTVSGLTDGTPPGVVRYKVRNPGQAFVSEVQ